MSEDDRIAEPLGVLDAELLAEIEQEFAELTAEIEKINNLPSVGAAEKTALVESLRASWHKRHEGKDRPEWRLSVDKAVDDAVDAVLKDSVEVDVDGNIMFNLKPEALGDHGKPLMNAAAVTLRAKLAEVLPGFEVEDDEDKDPGKLLADTLIAGAQAFFGKGLQNAITTLAGKGKQSFSFNAAKNSKIDLSAIGPRPQTRDESMVHPTSEASPAEEPAPPAHEVSGEEARLIPTDPKDEPIQRPKPPGVAKSPTPRPPTARRSTTVVVDGQNAPTPAHGPDMGTPASKTKDPDAIQVKIDIAGLLGALMGGAQPSTKKKSRRKRPKPKNPRPKKP